MTPEPYNSICGISFVLLIIAGGIMAVIDAHIRYRKRVAMWKELEKQLKELSGDEQSSD